MRIAQRFDENKFLVLNVVCFGLIASYPVLVESAAGVRLIGLLLGTGLVLTAFSLRRMSKLRFRLLVAFMLPGVLFSAGYGLADEVPWLRLVSEICSLSAFSICALAMLEHALTTPRISRENILAAVSVYFLLIFSGVQLFILIDDLNPNAFPMPHTGHHVDFLYFSMVTVTTLGYGDISPTSPAAKIAAACLALAGQLYIAILVARLVGLHVAQELRERPDA